MATTDKLTGAATRHAYDILTEQAVRDAHRQRQPLTAMLLDIDSFKAINDSHGHMAGDRILMGVANAIRACLRSRSEEHTSELQSLMRLSYAVFCLKKNNKQKSVIQSIAC